MPYLGWVESHIGWEVLVHADKRRKAETVKHPCSSQRKAMLPHLPPWTLGKRVVYDLVIFAILWARLHLNPPEYLLLYLRLISLPPLNLEPCFSVHKLILMWDVTCTTGSVTCYLGACPILTPTGIRHSSVILPRPYLEHCLSYQYLSLWKNPYVLCKSSQCKRVLNFVVHTGLS